MRFTGHDCPGDGCYEINGCHEYGGMCAACWLKLSDGQRAKVLDARDPDRNRPMVTQVHQHAHHYPPVPKWLTALIGVAGGLAGSAAWWLACHWLRR